MNQDFPVYSIKFQGTDVFWYYTDPSRRDLVAQGLMVIHKYMNSQPKPTQEQFSANTEIQRIFREVPECRLSYQNKIRQQVEISDYRVTEFRPYAWSDVADIK